jgi:hypothetical protein
MYTTQLMCNTTSVLSGGCAVGTLATGVATIAAVPLGLIGMVSGGIGIMLGTFDQKALKKMKKHCRTTQLSQSIDSQILKKYLSDQVITKEEFSEICCLFVGNIENLKKEFVEKGKKLAYLEAVRHNPKTELLISRAGEQSSFQSGTKN